MGSVGHWRDEDEDDDVPRASDRRDEGKNRFVGLLILLLGVYFVLERATGTDLRLFPFLATAFFASLAMKGAGWAWIPTGIFGFSVFTQIGGAFAASDLMLPTVFVVGGGMLLLRDRIPAVVRKGIFLVLGIMALGAIFGNDDHDHTSRRVDISLDRPSPPAEPSAIPELGRRRLVIVGSSGEVNLTARGTERRISGRVRITDTPVQVTVMPIGDASISVRVPTGSDVQVVTESGDVEAEGSWGSLTVTTDSGDVDVEWNGASAPALAVTTASGDVEVDVTGDPDVRITTAGGRIEVDGYEGIDDDPDSPFRHDGTSPGDIRVKTSSGDVDLSRELR